MVNNDGKAMRDIAHVGVVGLGKMGLPMAAHLLAAGYEVTGFDPDGGRRAAAEERGVQPVATAVEVAGRADGTLIVVGFDHQARELLVDSDDFLAACRPGSSILLTSTLAPATSLAVAERAASFGIHVADATMCRAEHAAVDGTLLMLFGGSEELLDTWRRPLETFASDIAHVGGIGSGQIAKMVNNVLLWITVVGNQEVLQLAESLGVQQRPLIDALLLSSGANWALETWHKARPMPWAEDDLNLALHEAASAALPMPVTALIGEEMKRIKATKHAQVAGGPSASMEAYVERMSRRET